MLSDNDEFHDRKIESRMASRAYLIGSILGRDPKPAYLESVSKYLINTAFRIDRDLEAMGLLPKESLKL